MPPVIRKHPLVVFIALVYLVEWIAVMALLPLSPMAVGVIALVPTPVALLAAAIAEGKSGPRRLLRQSLAWRVSPRWYALAILIPIIIHLLAAAGAVVAGARLTLRPEAFLAYLPLTLVLATGEEIGWQGYALPRLRAAFSPLSTAIIFGVVHAAFHLPMFLLPLPEELRQASPFLLFLLMATAFAFYRVWFFDRTDGSVPLIIFYHAAINTSVLLLNGVDRQLLGWLLPVIWILAALVLLATRGFGARTRGRRSDIRNLEINSN